MASITGLTAARMLAIEAASIVDGEIVGEDLILTKHDASTINAGSVRFDIPIVTALPGSPTDGQEVYYQNAAMAAIGALWHLRYRSGASGSYKWEFVGGTPLSHFVDTDASRGVAATTYGDLSGSSGPAVTVPLSGEYWILIGTSAYPWAQTQAMVMSYAIGASAAVDADGAWETYVNNTGGMLERRKFKTFAASTVLTAKYKGSSSIADKNFSGRYMSITPVRVS